MAVALCCELFVCVFGFYYVKYRGIVDARLKKPLFDNTPKIYAAPMTRRPRRSTRSTTLT
jgi:penicillin-binding protein 1B